VQKPARSSPADSLTLHHPASGGTPHALEYNGARFPMRMLATIAPLRRSNVSGELNGHVRANNNSNVWFW
jgi:hypothetical protein